MTNTLPKSITGLKQFVPVHLKQGLHIDKARDGLLWYKKANAFACGIKYKHGYSLPIVCAVIAVLSPAVSWDINMKDALALLSINEPTKEKLNKVTVSTYGQNKQKAIDIIMTGDLSLVKGRKVKSFYHNILNPDCDEHVTIDRHAIRACYGLKGLKMSGDSAKGLPTVSSDKRYNHFKTLYKRLADKYGVLPCQIQAIVWCEYRKQMGLG